MWGRLLGLPLHFLQISRAHRHGLPGDAKDAVLQCFQLQDNSVGLLWFENIYNSTDPHSHIFTQSSWIIRTNILGEIWWNHQAPSGPCGLGGPCFGAQEKGSLPSLVSPLFGAALLLACLHLGPLANLAKFRLCGCLDVSWCVWEWGTGLHPAILILCGGKKDTPVDGTGFFRYQNHVSRVRLVLTC